MNELKHVGIKGMRWGIRKSNQSSESNKTARTKKIKDVLKTLDKKVGDLKHHEVTKGQKIVLSLMVAGLGVIILPKVASKTKLDQKVGNILGKALNKRLGIKDIIYDEFNTDLTNPKNPFYKGK